MKFCHYHGMCRHTIDQCTTLKALVKHAKQKKSKHFDKKKVHQACNKCYGAKNQESSETEKKEVY